MQRRETIALRAVVLGAGLGGLELCTLLSEALAARLGETIRAENGVARAVAVVEQDFTRQQSA